MVTVYILDGLDYNEKHKLINSDGESFRIGYFSSRKLCEETFARYKTLPGFNRSTCNMVIQECSLDTDTMPEEVYCLFHEYPVEDDCWCENDYGVYLTKEEALADKEAILNGNDPKDDMLRMYPDNFIIEPCKIDKNLSWQYGFKSSDNE